MADTPSSILLLRLQSTGSNTNLWGGYLNTALQTQERATKGYQAYTVTGDATISWSNYSATNDFSIAYAKLTGSPTANFAITLPGVQHFFGAWNATIFTGTLKNSGGTGIAVPANRRALLYDDATDIGEASPNWISNYAITPSNNGDIIVKATLDQALANITAPAVSGAVLIDGFDTTAGFVASKVNITGTGSARVTQTIGNPGGNETLNVNVAVSVAGLVVALAR